MIFRGVRMKADEQKRQDRKDILKAVLITLGVAVVTACLVMAVRSITVG